MLHGASLEDRRTQRCTLAVLLAVMLVAALTLAGCSASARVTTGTVWFEDISNRRMLSEQDAIAVAAYAATAVYSPGEAGDAPRILSRDGEPRIVFISTSNGNGPATVVIGARTGIGPALEEALDAIEERKGGDGPPRYVKVDIVQEVYPVLHVPPGAPQPTELERSLFGLAFEEETGIAFLPEAVVAQMLINSDRELQFGNMADYWEEQEGAGEAIGQLAEAARLNIYRFSTLGVFSDGGEPIPLYRGHRLFEAEELRADDLLATSIAAGEYLTRAVYPDGRFEYIYLPKSDRVPDDYNILRHAGTTYSMLELYEVTGNSELLKAATRALDYLILEAGEPCSLNGVEALCIVENAEVKLGGAGLTAVALAKYIELTGDQTYLPQLRLLGRWIQAAQGESGEFLVHKQEHPNGPVSDFRSSYYPGEALLALARIYAIDPDEGWLDTAERGAQWLITVRDGGKSTDQLDHDHWLLYALNDLYRYRPDPLYLDHAMRIAEAMIASQNRDPAYRDWLGGYHEPPGSTPAATRSEGLMAAYKLARDYGSQREAARILEAVRYGVAFQLQTQFWPERTLYLDNPQRALGGFSRDLTNYEIRIDYVQHNLSSILALRGAISD